MAEVTILVCDKCKAEDAETYIVLYPSGPVRHDLCERHAKPINSLKDSGLPWPGEFVTRQRSANQHRIVASDPRELGLD